MEPCAVEERGRAVLGGGGGGGVCFWLTPRSSKELKGLQGAPAPGQPAWAEPAHLDPI